jgi:protein-S-isoprenylcysteine O-methyltransferase Ste14
MTRLELRVPPPAVFLLCATAMWLLSAWMPALTVEFPWRGAVACALLAAGSTVAFAGVAAFRRYRTTVNPMHPESTTALITAGIYGFTRNPMYVGLLLALMGWAAWLASMVALVMLPVFVAYLGRFQIEPEERALATRFGEEFTAYCRRVRRWV